MNLEKENERHAKIIEQINNAKTRAELPNITVNTLAKYFADNVYFDGKKLQPAAFLPVIEARIGYGIFFDVRVKDAFIKVLKENYPTKTDDEYQEKLDKVIKSYRAEKIMTEIHLRNKKINELLNDEDLKKHKEVMHAIGAASEIKELPKVSRAMVARLISDNSKTEYNKKISTNYMKELLTLLIDKKCPIENDEIQDELYNICKQINPWKTEDIYSTIYSRLLQSKKIKYLIEEVCKKETKIKMLYKQEHDFTMSAIEDATRISELPPNMSISRITSYLSGNSIIYSKAKPIPSNDFNEVADMLLRGKAMLDDSVRYELLRIATKNYPDKPHESYRLLCQKLDKLPKVYYYVEEVKYARKRIEDFVARAESNVNVYLVPNPKSPIDGGKFYNCYINRAQNLNLEEILPLDLDNIVPNGMDVDAIEWYVRKHYDNTFKAAGGIILARDEKIGNVKIFKPSDGKISITKEEKSNYDELKELSVKLKEIMKKRKEEADSFAKMQEAFINSQQQISEELEILETRISELTSDSNEKVKKKGSN